MLYRPQNEPKRGRTIELQCERRNSRIPQMRAVSVRLCWDICVCVCADGFFAQPYKRHNSFLLAARTPGLHCCANALSREEGLRID